MDKNNVTSQNDHKVVSFHNSTEFDFTPAMGCMFDGRPVNGKTGTPGISAGETVVLPFHIGNQLALNLAKMVSVNVAPKKDAEGIPTGVPLWDTDQLENLKLSFIKDLYTEDRPLAMTDTDKLMAKVEEYKAMVEKLIPTAVEASETASSESTEKVFQDKQEVITELEKREIVHDKRKSKDELVKLLA